MGRTIAVVSQKGGVGKTTTAVNLAAAFGRRGVRTTLVDVDPQGAVRFGIGLPLGTPADGIADLLAGRRTLEQVLLPTALPRLRVLLVGSIAEQGHQGDYQRRLADGDTLARLIADVGVGSEVVIVDTPPGLGPLVRAVLAASDEVLIPVQCEPLALQTTPQLLRGLQEVLATHEHLALLGLLLTMHDEANPVSDRVCRYIRETVPADMLLDITIPRTLGAVDAFAAGQPVVLRAPGDPAATAYLELATLLAGAPA